MEIVQGLHAMTAHDAELSAEELASIRAPIERARTLPARAFASRSFFELEAARICSTAAGWRSPSRRRCPRPATCVRLSSSASRWCWFAATTAYCAPFTTSVPTTAVNSRCAPSNRAAKAIEVYYHGWRYDLRGRLLAAPLLGRHAGRAIRPVSEDEMLVDLVEIRSGTRLGLLFVDLGGARRGRWTPTSSRSTGCSTSTTWTPP